MSDKGIFSQPETLHIGVQPDAPQVLELPIVTKTEKYTVTIGGEVFSFSQQPVKVNPN